MEYNKKLQKSSSDRKLFGVCGGLAEYFNMDSTLMRIIWIVFGCMGWGIVAYIITAIVMPD